MDKLALLGGTPIKAEPTPWVSTMETEELEAVISVMKSGNLSYFFAKMGPQFLGGPKVKEFEQAFAKRFNSRFAVSFNSATTALHAAIAACEIGPGDEVLVTPYSMSATASAILMNNAVPIFVDIDADTYNINPQELEKWLSPHTKAIMVANIFGLPANYKEILAFAQKHNLYVIEDNAQGPGATIDGQEAGTFGHIGVFSLNYHKVIHSGEGGMIITSDKDLAYRCQLLRNHAEVALDDTQDYEHIVLGSNYRMSELHAAIGLEQLKKLDKYLPTRRQLAEYLTKQLTKIDGLTGVIVPEGYTHSYYVYPIQFGCNIWQITRATFAAAMQAEGFPLNQGYVKPIYLMPMYQHKYVYNKTTYPFAFIEKPTQEYKLGICPVVEDMHFNTLLVADLCRVPFTVKDIDEFIAAVEKVKANLAELQTYEKNNISGT